MFGSFSGGDERISFLVEYLVIKGIISENAASWINVSGGSGGVKIDMLTKSEHKQGVVSMMDAVSYKEYTEILSSNLLCRKCGGKVLARKVGFIMSHSCNSCGVLNGNTEVELDFTKVQNEVDSRVSKLQV